MPAQEPKKDAEAAPETEEEKKEREGRRKCAAQLCATLHNSKPADGHVACNVQKTWRKEVLTKILSRGKVSWPWGDARCASELKFDRATLIKAMQEPDFEAQFDTYAFAARSTTTRTSTTSRRRSAPRLPSSRARP